MGTETRDKDAVTAAVLIVEVALHARRKSKTLLDLLHGLYKKYGFYLEKLLSINFPETKTGKEQMAKGMEALEKTPPTSILGIAVDSIDNYKISLKTYLKTGQTEPLTLPKTDALVFWLEDGSKLIVRPSGTEPKIKIYCGIAKRKYESLDEVQQQAEQQATALLQALESIIKA